MGFTAIDNVITRIQAKIDKKTEASFKEFDKIMGDLDKKIGAGLKNKLESLQGSLFGIGLGALFGGMAIARLGDTIIRALVGSFTQARAEGDLLVNQLLGVQASFEFLKFAIFDTFAQTDMFMDIIDAIITINSTLGQWIAKNPALAQGIVLLGGIAVVLGKVMMVLGQVVLLTLLAINALLLLSPAALIKVLGFLFTMQGSIGWLISNLAVLGGMFIGIGKAIVAFALSPIGLALVALIGGIALLSSELGGLGNAFKALGIFVLRLLAAVGDGISDIVLGGLNLVIAAINKVIRASNRFLGTSFEQIGFIETETRLGERVDELRDKLLAEAAAGKEAEAGAGGSVVNNITIDNTAGDDSKLVEMLDKALRETGNFQLGAPNRG